MAKRGADGTYLNGWDPLLQNGLADPTLDPLFRPMLDQLRDQLTVRLRTYEMSTARDDHGSDCRQR